MKRFPLFSFALLGAFALGACSDSVTDPATALSRQAAEKAPAANNMSDKGNALPPGDQSITEIAIAAENEFNELVAALSYVDEELDAGLVDLFLNGTDQFTVFAPTDDAFVALYAALGDDVSVISDLDPELVLDVLLYHVTEGRRGSSSVVPPKMPRKIETLLGQTFSVDSDGLITTASGGMANFVPAFIDISASNGIIHVIDAVLVPAGEAGDDDGEDNGRRPGELSLAQIAIDAGFSELVGALTYVDDELDAGLVDLFLNGTDQFTVFAPTNEAFDNLFDALGIDEITDLDSDFVLDVLLYHVTEGRRGSNSVVPPRMPRVIETLLGQTFSVDSDGLITTSSKNTANFVPDFIDISASNGIIHVIDTVLVPEI